jgi:hypothetical protein
MYSGNETGNAGNCKKESSDAESEAVHSETSSHYQHVSIRETISQQSPNFESTKNERTVRYGSNQHKQNTLSWYVTGFMV